MPKELFEIRNFAQGIVSNTSESDISPEAASYSLNVDPIHDSGKLKGRRLDVTLGDVGNSVDKNIVIKNLNDSSKFDLIQYKNSTNNVYGVQDLYGGSIDGTQVSLGTITSSADEVDFEDMDGNLYLGAGIGDGDDPKWIGRMIHGQFGSTATNNIIMEDDSLLPPNMINETTTACSDGEYIYSAWGGHLGNIAEGTASYTAHTTAHDKLVGEITKIRISGDSAQDTEIGTVKKRSSIAMGYIHGVCVSWDNNFIWVVASNRWSTSNFTQGTTWNDEDEGGAEEYRIYKLKKENLDLATTYITNIHTLIHLAGEPNFEDANFTWNSEYTAFERHAYAGCISDIIEIDGDLWVCTSSGALFKANASNPTTFEDYTPKWFGYYGATAGTPVTGYRRRMPRGEGDGSTAYMGQFLDGSGSSQSWRMPQIVNASLMQLQGSTSYVGMYARCGELSGTINLDLDGASGSSVLNIVGKSLIIARRNIGTDEYIEGDKIKVFTLNDSSLLSGTIDSTLPTQNVMYKSPTNVYKSAYLAPKTFTSSSIECNILKFDNPSTTDSHGGSISVTAVESDDVNQIPILISDTKVVGLFYDSYLSVLQHSTVSSSDRNNYRKINVWEYDSSWSKSSIGQPSFMSICATASSSNDISNRQTDSSDMHVEDTGYFYRFSFIYDGAQESPLGAGYNIKSTGKQVDFSFTFNTDNLPQRVTAVRIYKATSISTENMSKGGFYNFVQEIDLVEARELNLNSSLYAKSIQDSSYQLDEVVDFSTSRLLKGTDSGPSGGTYETMSGLISAMTDCNVKYALSTQLNNSLFVAKCKHHSQKNAQNFIYKSLPYKPSAINWAMDFLKLPETPTAIKAFQGRIYAFSETKVYRIDPNTFYIEDVFDGAGCFGQESVAVTDYGMCFCDSNNIYLHNGQTAQSIGNPIIRDDGSNGYQQLVQAGITAGANNPQVSFEPRTKSWIIGPVNSTNLFVFNIQTSSWYLWSVSSALDLFQGKKEGECLFTDSSGNVIDLAAHDSTRTEFTWHSGRLPMGFFTQPKKFYEVAINYEGTAPTPVINFDYSDDAATIADGNSVTNILKKTLGSVQKNLVKIKLTGSADTKVDSIGFTLRRFAKLIDQQS